MPSSLYFPNRTHKGMRGIGPFGDNTRASRLFWGLASLLWVANAFAQQIPCKTRIIRPMAEYQDPLSGQRTITPLKRPQGIAVDSRGTIFVADTHRSIVIKISEDGKSTWNFGSPDLPGHVDGAASSAKFHTPVGLAFAPDGSLVVADAGNRSLRKISVSGQVSTLKDEYFVQGKSDWGTAAGPFDYPTDLTVDNRGNVIFADSYKLRVLSNSGRLSTIPTATLTALRDVMKLDAKTDALAARELQGSAGGVAISKSGDIYITDIDAKLVKKISPNGEITALFGSRTAQDTGRPMDMPRGLVLDDQGSIFVADSRQGRILQITRDGIVAELQDSAACRQQGIPALREPTGLALGANGNLYITDASTGEIRIIPIVGNRQK